MRYAILIASAAFLAGPAFGKQPPEVLAIPDVCKTMPMAKSTKEFAVNFSAANTAYQAKDYAGSLEAIEKAKLHAASGAERSAITQIEIATRLGLGDTEGATALLKAAVDDPCLGPAARKNFSNMLAEDQ
jgi:hypothetical protein